MSYLLLLNNRTLQSLDLKPFPTNLNLKRNKSLLSQVQTQRMVFSGHRELNLLEFKI